ncbi:hypothetical protein ABZ319_10635 [Nocardia sp. NPDC005978]|uniref:hypothetical protein n=1 Tax=Nocardia sp. NPDC005978 TaxID=3156725 RepID=UPI0033A82464
MTGSENAFTDLKTDGRNGGLTSSESVLFNPEAATTLAQQAAAMLNHVDVALQAVQSTTHLKPLNQRTSGAQLADKFNAAAKKLVETVLPHHQTILTDMGETFVSAGRVYLASDNASAAAFSGTGGLSDQQISAAFTGFRSGGAGRNPSVQVAEIELPGWKQSSLSWNEGTNATYKWSGGTRKEDFGNKLSDTTESTDLAGLARQVALDTVLIVPDRAAQYEWDDFYNHWVYIKDSKVIDDLEKYAQEVNKARAYLEAGARDFKAAADKYLKGGYQGSTTEIEKIWASPAALKAKEAVTKYTTTLDSLAKSLEVLSTNYAYTQGWVKRLQNFLPNKPIDLYFFPQNRKVQQDQIREAMEKLREAWKQWYEVGVENASGAIPIMPDPQNTVPKPVAVQPQPQPQPQTQPQGGAPGSQSPGGSSPGSPGGSPGTTTTEEQQRAADEAARLAAEAAAAQAAATAKQAEEATKQKALETAATTASEALTSLQTIASEGLTALQSLASEGLTSLSTIASEGATALQNLLDGLTTEVSTEEVPKDTVVPTVPGATDPAKTTGGGGAGGGGGSPGGSPVTTKDTTVSKVTPRAAVATEAETTTSSTSRAGLATAAATTSGTGTGMGMGGTPMGGAGAGAQGQGKEHKRPEYLKGAENLDEALGDVPVAVTPVAER